MTRHILVKVPAVRVYRQSDICLVDLGPKEDAIKAIQDASDDETFCDLVPGDFKSPDVMRRVKRIIQFYGSPGIALKDVIYHATKQGLTEGDVRKCIAILCERAEAIMTKGGEVMLV